MPANNRRHEDEAAEEAHSHRSAEESAEAADGLTDRQAALLGLSQTIGNQAVGALLRQSRGQALPDKTRTGMEARLGQPVTDDVRVHTGAAAERSAQGLGARAYTVGSEVVFGAGEFAPGTERGDELLAHELAHVVQQDAAGQSANPGRLNPSGHASEQQAQTASQGKPTLLNAAPAGIARAEGDNEPTAVVDEAPPAPTADAVPPAAAGSPPVPTTEVDVTAEDLARDAAIDDSIEVADTRARTMLNTDYNDIQDAARDFEGSTADGIDSLDAEPSGYLGIASTIVGLASSAVSARYHKLAAVGLGSSVFSTMFSMAQTSLTAAVTKTEDTDPKAAAKSIMHSAAKAISYAQAAFFSNLRADLHSVLVKQAQRQPDVADLLAVGSVANIDEVLSDYIGVPNPDTDPLYGPVREAMEIAFEDWRTKQERKQTFHWITEDMGLSNWAAEPGRAAARARTAEAVAARSGEPKEPAKPWGETIHNAVNTGLNSALTVAFTGQLPAVDEAPAAEPPTGPVDTLEPVDEATEAAEQQRENAIGRGVALADTRAREHLNTHYQDVQDAVRDFVSSGEEKLGTLNGAISGHWGLVSAIFGAAMGVISTRFPPEAVGSIIKLAAGAAGAAGLSTVITTAVDDARASDSDDGLKALHALGAGTANTQAGVFRQARAGLADALLAVSTGKDEKAETARMLLESGDRDGLNAVVEENLGVPDPDLDPLYARVRLEMEIPFADWVIRQQQNLEGNHYLSAYDTNTAPANRAVEADAALRDANSGDEKPVGPDTYAVMDEDKVGPEPPVNAPPGEKTVAQESVDEDRMVLRRITEVDTRARGYLNTLADEVQDAVRDFVPRALNQTAALSTDWGDKANFANNMLGIGFAALGFFFPPLGVGLAIAGAVTGIVAQGVTGWETDKNASAQQNARVMINATAKTTQAGYVSAFRTARRALGPALIAAGLLDEDAREALLVGGQDNYDYVIQDKLGIPKADSGALYLKTRTDLENEFTDWMTKQLDRDSAAHEAALKEGQAAAAEDDAARRGDKGGGQGTEAKKH